jgi:hypothetical protein
MTEKEFRERLHSITKSAEVSRHRNLIRALHSEYPHSIRVLSRNNKLAPAQPLYTCFAYAFDLADCSEYTALARRPFSPFANSDFVKLHLRSNNLNFVPLGESRSGDVIVYFMGDEPTHAAVFRAKNRVISKWGVGNLCEHALFEAPSSYGETIQVVRGNSRESALHSFKRFCIDEAYDEEE